MIYFEKYLIVPKVSSVLLMNNVRTLFHVLHHVIELHMKRMIYYLPPEASQCHLSKVGFVGDAFLLIIHLLIF